MKMVRTSWFKVGYDEGFAGKESRVPEGYSVRMNYLRGWNQGDTDRRCAAAGYQIMGDIDPDLGDPFRGMVFPRIARREGGL